MSVYRNLLQLDLNFTEVLILLSDFVRDKLKILVCSSKLISSPRYYVISIFIYKQYF